MVFEYRGVKASFCKGVYEPAEDTFLLMGALESEKWSGKESVLEIGCGTGIVSIFLAKKVRRVYALDINPCAALCAKENARQNNADNVHIFCSGLFSAIEPGKKFDAIVFNTPYLPEDEETKKFGDLAWSGGQSGRKIIDKFLRGAVNRLSSGGTLFIVESSLSKYEKTMQFLKERGFAACIAARNRAFFEEIVAIRARTHNTNLP